MASWSWRWLCLPTLLGPSTALIWRPRTPCGGGELPARASGKPDDVVRVLADAIHEWKETSRTPLYPARAFCLHELVASEIEPKGADGKEPATWREATAAVLRFAELGMVYHDYSPDGLWRPSRNPVDLNPLASDNLDSRWGRQAFLMMTQRRWSGGGCREGPDQFREVIRQSEKFLKQYPESEVSESVRLEHANAYATWWSVANDELGPYRSPEKYTQGAEEARQRAIQLYQGYWKTQTRPHPEIQKRLSVLPDKPQSSKIYDYFYADYADWRIGLWTTNRPPRIMGLSGSGDGLRLHSLGPRP